ncbi:hypothetical protein ACFX15_027358 [Malus domestica]
MRFGQTMNVVIGGMMERQEEDKMKKEEEWLCHCLLRSLHVVTALLILSLCEDNKGSIISSGAVPGIVHVLKNGGMEARENAATTLFSLSIVDNNKVMIGTSGAIPPLVVKGDPARKSDGQKTHVEHHFYDASLFGVSDNALKPTYILYNLSPAVTFAFVDHQEDAHFKKIRALASKLHLQSFTYKASVQGIQIPPPNNCHFGPYTDSI